MFNVSKYAKAGASLGGHVAACLDANAVCRHFQERKAVSRLAFTKIILIYLSRDREDVSMSYTNCW